jgi:hypothetical protein
MPTSRALSADWSAVLTRVEGSLAQAIAKIEQREQALAALPPFAPSSQPLDFAKFEKTLAKLAGRQSPAEATLSQLDADLAAGEELMRQWLVQAEACRKQLAAWVGRAVG